MSCVRDVCRRNLERRCDERRRDRRRLWGNPRQRMRRGPKMLHAARLPLWSLFCHGSFRAPVPSRAAGRPRAQRGRERHRLWRDSRPLVRGRSAMRKLARLREPRVHVGHVPGPWARLAKERDRDRRRLWRPVRSALCAWQALRRAVRLPIVVLRWWALRGAIATRRTEERDRDRRGLRGWRESDLCGRQDLHAPFRLQLVRMCLRRTVCREPKLRIALWW